MHLDTTHGPDALLAIVRQRFEQAKTRADARERYEASLIADIRDFAAGAEGVVLTREHARVALAWIDGDN